MIYVTLVNKLCVCVYTLALRICEHLHLFRCRRFYLPHGLAIDGEGNYWMTDVALHQVRSCLIAILRGKEGNKDR